MPEITDPDLLAQLSGNINVTEGRGVGSSEAKTQEGQLTGNQTIRDFVGMLMQGEAFNRRLPTGRFNAAANNFFQNMPTAWQPEQIADYQSMAGLRSRMLIPSIAMTAPPGMGGLSQLMNAVKEAERQESVVPGPEKEKQANQYLTDALGKTALERLANNSFMQSWRAKLGSAHAPNKAGETADRAFSRFMASPAAAPVRKPLTKYYDEALARRGVKAAADMSDDELLRALNGR